MEKGWASFGKQIHGVSDSPYVRLSIGDGVHGEPLGSTCAYDRSLVLFTWLHLHIQPFVFSAIGCGETLSDTGSAIFCHGSEIPYLFGLWFHRRFLVKLSASRRVEKSSQIVESSTMLTARCSRPKFVALDDWFSQDAKAFMPISVAAWIHVKVLPHVFERRRPTASDHAAAVEFSTVWASTGNQLPPGVISSKQSCRQKLVCRHICEAT